MGEDLALEVIEGDDNLHKRLAVNLMRKGRDREWRWPDPLERAQVKRPAPANATKVTLDKKFQKLPISSMGLGACREVLNSPLYAPRLSPTGIVLS